METLNQLCFNTIQHNNTQQNIYDVLPEHLYNAYVNDLCEQNFQNWSDKIKLVNLELNIDDIDVEPDMFMGDLTHKIYVKKKNDNLSYEEDEMDGIEEDYQTFHEYQDDTGNYNNYYKIAQINNLI